MIQIKADCQDQAQRMLQTSATQLLQLQKETFYLLDGKVWKIDDEVVYRSDDQEESDTLRTLCKALQEVPIVVVIQQAVIQENILCYNAQHAEQVFKQKCQEYVAGWDTRSHHLKQADLEDGYVMMGTTDSICLSYAMRPIQEETQEQPESN